MVRLKTRYLLVQIYYPTKQPPDPDALPETLRYHAPTPDTLTAPLLLSHLRRTIATLFGDLGAGLASGPGSLTVKYLSTATSTFVLRCPRAWLRLVWAALAFTTELPAAGKGSGEACVLRVVRVSGAFRKIEFEILRRDREFCRGLKAQGRELITESLDNLSEGKEGGGLVEDVDDEDGEEDEDDGDEDD